jgi:hypothetical protein
MENIRDYLQSWIDMAERVKADGGQQVLGPELVSELLFAHAREYQSVPWTTWRGRGYRRGKVKECYRNAMLLALANPELTYVEGYGFSGLIPCPHAWCATEEGRVVDPTWRANDELPVEQWEYLGIPFDTLWAAVTMDERGGTYGVLDKLDYRSDEPLPLEALA